MKKAVLIGSICLFMALFFMSSLSTLALAQEKKIPGKTVNINKATAEEIAKSCPLIPLGLAKKIVQYREEVGVFQSLEELLQVEGMNKTLLNRAKPFLLLEGLGGSDCTC